MCLKLGIIQLCQHCHWNTKNTILRDPLRRVIFYPRTFHILCVVDSKYVVSFEKKNSSTRFLCCVRTCVTSCYVSLIWGRQCNSEFTPHHGTCNVLCLVNRSNSLCGNTCCLRTWRVRWRTPPLWRWEPLPRNSCTNTSRRHSAAPRSTRPSSSRFARVGRYWQ